MSTMTKIAGVPDRNTAIPGMAFFAGTGPASTTCGTCKFRGYVSEEHQAPIHYGCSMFRRLSGKHGPIVHKGNESCKYYEKN
jgi:hypothetical protein